MAGQYCPGSSVTTHVVTGPLEAQHGRLLAVSTMVEPSIIARWIYMLIVKMVENIFPHALMVIVLDHLQGYGTGENPRKLSLDMLHQYMYVG